MAERIKTLFGGVVSTGADDREMIDAPKIGEEDLPERRQISRGMLIGVIRPRIEEILEAVVDRVPPPRLADYPQARTLVFDSVYDSYKGVICYVRMFSGSLKRGDKIQMMSDAVKAEVKEVGIFTPQMKDVKEH